MSQNQTHSFNLTTMDGRKVVLELDFSGALWGYTELQVVPTNDDLRTVHLHSRQCKIHDVTVNGEPVDYVHHDLLASISLPAPDETDCHRHPELKRRLYSALQECEEGELSITTRGGLVRIDYSLHDPVDGIQFVIPTDEHPYRVPHIYTTPSSPDAARCWVPCIDSQTSKCTWEFEFVVPSTLEDTPVVVVASGEFVEHVVHPYNSSKLLFMFALTVPTSPQHVGFAAGPFHVLSLPDPDDAPDALPIHAFCLPNHAALLQPTTAALRPAMSYYSADFGAYPYSSFKAVFVDELPVPRFDTAALAIAPTSLLHGEDSIEAQYEARHALAHALACQWVGVNILPRAWSDLWLVNGLALYMTGLYIRKTLGNNEYRFRLKKDMLRVQERDNGNMRPICEPTRFDPPDKETLDFINLKGPCVLHILDKRLGKSGTSLGLSRVLPKIFLSAISGDWSTMDAAHTRETSQKAGEEGARGTPDPQARDGAFRPSEKVLMHNNTISTNGFLRTCRKISGVDLRTFAEQWIYGSGCPTFGFQAQFNRKKMAIEITMRQDCPAHRVLSSDPISTALLKPVPFFEGTMTIRIHEADGTPYEHVLDITAPFKRYDVPFNTKYKRVRRNTKRYLAKQAAAQAAADDEDGLVDVGLVDVGFGVEVCETETEREAWKMAEWTEEEENAMSGATYEWIRIDADFEWIAGVAFEQPDYMWISQLQRDRDVVAQLEALYALSSQPTAVVSTVLTKTILVTNYFYRIRCEAALALVQCAIRKLEFLGLYHLFKLFLRYCYAPEDPAQDLFTHKYVPKPNDFSDLAEYFVRKALITAISRVRFENGKTPTIVRQFLIDQLRFNDNTANPYADAVYICAMISALACATVSTAPPERGELLPNDGREVVSQEDADLLQRAREEVDRYRSMDRLIPSMHNMVTIAALEFYQVLTVANLIPSHQKIFFPLTREGNYTQVRITAFDGIFLTRWCAPPVMRYIFSVIANDPSRAVRRAVARGACVSLALLVQMGDIRTGSREAETLLIEEDGTTMDRQTEAKKSETETAIKALRKDKEVGKNEVLREWLFPLILAPDADSEVRWCLLKLADLLIKPTEEKPHVPAIHIPATPVVERPPTPTIPVKIPIKPRALKLPATPSPLPSAGPKTSIHIPKSAPLPKAPKEAAPDPLNIVPSKPLKTPRTNNHRKPPARPATPSALTSVVPRTPRANVVAAPPKRVPAPPPAADASSTKTRSKPTKPPSASKGMSPTDLRASRNVLQKLQRHKNGRIFLIPVDPIRDQAPHYFDVVKHPMDLSTISAKLEGGLYKDRFAFQADFRLMIANAKHYNLVESFAHKEAIGLETFFEKRRFSRSCVAILLILCLEWAVINRTLEQAEKSAVPRPIQPPPVASAADVPRPLPPASASAPAPAPVPSARKITIVPRPVATPKRDEEAQTSPPTSSTPVPARPMIKLKVGGSKTVEPSRPPKRARVTFDDSADLEVPVDMPPPSYVDDGSHDILQEVLALEREKDEKKEKQRHKNLTVEKVVASTSAMKRKKPEADLSDDEDVLTYPSPPRRERVGSMPPPPVPVERRAPPMVVKKPSAATAIEKKQLPLVEKKQPPVVEKRLPPAVVAKSKEKEKSTRPSDPPVASSSKGKEREAPSGASTPTQIKKKATVANATPIHGHEKQLKDLMKTLQKLPDAAIFLRPVDPVKDGCPTYYDEIKEPMDLGTMTRKLTMGEYTTLEGFKKDMELMLRNCRQFNITGTFPILCADAVERLFRKEWPSVLEKRMPFTEKRGLQGLMTTLAKDVLSTLFLEAVDPIKLNIPTYFDVIPRNQARDLTLIRQKLDSDKYDSVEAFEEDMDLMVRNCITFNGRESPAGKWALTFQAKVNDMLAKWKANVVRKRKDTEQHAGSQPPKKIRLS
ncbi:hypothetical protein FISHEDRAFT_63651 [Fistulina hepatica ATCC 64428]|uniref:Transcription initiation factor TFIID subunit 2 n=1 Tax=Fistulina hepatica ATCC 64428 TaxID=1128425 RepID=A0A0D7AMY2_9AGAR|nr:hypothetical protein FISHEDRAFT_63651 [Fistulina hepatica ATCC 64428]